MLGVEMVCPPFSLGYWTGNRVRGEVLACTLHGRVYWLLLCRPAPEFVIAVRVVHGVPMIWSDRGNRQTNQKMVWLGVLTGFQDFRTLAQSLSGRSLLRGAAVCSQDILQ